MTDKVTRLVVKADPSNAIQAAEEAKKAWLEVDKVTQSLGKGNVFGGGSAGRGVVTPGGGGGAAPGAATSTPGGGFGVPAGLRPGSGPGGLGFAPMAPGSATTTPGAFAPGTVLGPGGQPVSAPQGAPAAVPGASTADGGGSGSGGDGGSAGGRQPPGGGVSEEDGGDKSPRRGGGAGATGNSIARAMQAMSMAVRGGPAGPELATLGMAGMGFNAWAARSKPGSWQHVVAGAGAAGLPLIGSAVAAGASQAQSRVDGLLALQSQMQLALLQGVGRPEGAGDTVSRARIGPDADVTTTREVSRDLGYAMHVGQRMGYNAQETAAQLAQYANARGTYMAPGSDPFADDVSYYKRLGVSEQAVGHYTGLAAAGVANMDGSDFRSVVGLGWQQGFRGDKLVQYLQAIASNTESLAQQGIEVSQAGMEEFMGRMQATPELRDQGMKQVQAKQGLESVAEQAASTLLAPFQQLAVANTIVGAFGNGRNYTEAVEWLKTSGKGDESLAQKVNVQQGGDDSVGTLTRAAVTGLTPSRARGFNPGHFASEPETFSLPSQNDAVPALAKKKAENDNKLTTMVEDRAEKILDRLYMTVRAEISAFVVAARAVEGAVDGLAEVMRTMTGHGSTGVLRQP